MADQDDKNLDAAERALGTEPRDKESAEERRAREDWDSMLAPLALAAPPAGPPADMFERIERRIEGKADSATDGAADSAQVIRLAERRVRRWRAAAVAMTGIAACLALWIAIDPIGPGAPPTVPQRNYVALVTPEGGGGPAMIVEVRFADPVGEEAGVVTVQPLSIEAPEDRVLELWRIPPGETPQSVGLVDPDQPTLFNVAVEPGDVMAITVEPPGGAPGGIPSGPPILSGPLVETR